MRNFALALSCAALLVGCGDNLTGNQAPELAGRSVTTAEDTPVEFTVSATDPEGKALRFTADTPAHGTIAVSGGTFTYTPEADYNGADSVQVTVTDGDLSATATVTITVTPVNDPPVAADDEAAADEDVAATITAAALLANDTDVDGDALTITAVAGATNGTVALAGTDITFTPAADFVGDASFEYTVSDGTDTDTATVTVTVGGTNDPPVAVDDAAATAEDSELVLLPATLLANDTDPEGQALSITAVSSASNGTVALVGGEVRFQPAADFNGTAGFDYTVSDGAATDVGHVTVTVTPVNDAPVAVDDTATTAEDTALTLTGTTLTANDTDVDGPALSITAVAGATNGTVALVGGDVTFTPAANFSGTAGFDYTVSDGTDTDTGHVTVTVTPVNDAPVAVDDTATTAEDTALTIAAATLTANDTDVDGPALSITAVAGATNGTVALAGGNVTFTPAANFTGTAGFDYTVSDGTATDVGHVTVTVTPVNDAPIAVDDTATTAEDTALTLTGATLTANDTDIDGPALSVTAVAGATNGTVALAGGNVTFTPAANFSGTAGFDYTVSDGTATDVGHVTVTVTAVNDAPVAVDDTATTAEDTALTIAAATLTANDTDVDGPALSITAVSGATGGTVALAGSTITFTPTANFTGTAGFDYTVSDGTATDVGHVTVTVTPVNDAPVAVDDTATTAEDTALTLTGATLTANDTDVDGPALSITAVAGATNGTVALAGGNVTFTPAANFNGTAGFDYTVSDGTASDTGHVTVTVTPVNDAPVAVDDAGTTNQDIAVTFTDAALLANDVDVDGPALTVTAVGNAVNGTVARAGGVTTFTPTAGFTGFASFEYTVSDGTLSDTGLVSISIGNVNDPPIATDDSATTAEDTAVTITTATLIVNDIDFDSDPLTVTAVGNPVNGTVALVAGVVTFTPAANFNGTASFEYTVSDGTLSDVGLVTITVTPVNDAPVAVDDTATTLESTPVAITGATLTANDTDIDGPSLSVVAVSNPSNGTVVLAGGDVTFTPTPGFDGIAGFDYTVSDGSLTSVAHVTVTVTAVNTPVVAIDDAASVSEDTPTTIAGALLTGNDIDPDPDTLTVTAVNNPVNGTVALAGGDVVFTPDPNYNGPASFEYTVSDGTATDVGLVTITVTPVNDAPVANGQSGTLDENTTLTLTLAGTDVEGDALTFAIATPPTSGTLGAITQLTTTTASVVYTPTVGFSGTDAFTFTVNDGQLTSAPATVSLTINNVAVCGDGLIEGAETCDDNGTAPGDGCSATCQVENGWACTGAPSACDEVCGDSVVVGGEQCDDGPGPDTDGCTSQCIAGPICTATAVPGGAAYSTDAATGHCYVTISGSTSWADAQADCVARRGYLMTITSAAEQMRLHTLHHIGIPWIGGNDLATEGTFRWVTTEPFGGFTSFAAGEPDDDVGVGGNGDCLAAVDGLANWGDTNCGFVGFTTSRVCELPPVTCGDGILHPGEACDDGNSNGGDGCSATCVIETPFFSEYLEGSSNTKALEIHNPTAAAVSCTLGIYVNGSATRTSVTAITVPANDQWVVCNSSSGSLLIGNAACNQFVAGGVVNFNGDDAVDLICGTTVDIIGQIGLDPGTEWGSAPVSTLNTTLRRKCDQTVGDTVGGDAFVPSLMWNGAPIDTFANLGTYSCP